MRPSILLQLLLVVSISLSSVSVAEEGGVPGDASPSDDEEAAPPLGEGEAEGDDGADGLRPEGADEAPLGGAYASEDHVHDHDPLHAPLGPLVADQDVPPFLPAAPPLPGPALPLAIGATPGANRLSPILFLHGYDGDPVGDPDHNIQGSYLNMASRLSDWGWQLARMEYLSFYQCDIGYTIDLDNHGSHSSHNGPRSQDGNHDSGGTCTSGRAVIGKHERGTAIEHLGYHFAWAAYDRFWSLGTCVNVVSYSMGGLIVRYALEQVQEGHWEFPPWLCIENSVTLATPHGGANYASACPYYQCGQMVSGSSFISNLDPGPEGYGGTQWTTMGSFTDAIVSETSANGMNAHRELAYDETIYHSDSPSWFSAHTGAIDANTIDAELRLWDSAFGSTQWNDDAPWPARFADMSMAYDEWGCGRGTTAAAWPLQFGDNIAGEPYTAVHDCWYRISASGMENMMVRAYTPAGLSRTVKVHAGSPSGSQVCSGASDAYGYAYCAVAAPSGTYYVRVQNVAGGTNPFELATWEVYDDIQAITVTSAPSTVQPYQDFQVCWRVEGIGQISHTHLHWGTTSGSHPYGSSGQSGSMPQSFCGTLTATGGGKMYIKAHASSRRDEMYSYPETVVTVQAEITSTRVTSSPEWFELGGNGQICWRVEGSGDISHTNIHSGRYSSDLSTFSAQKTGSAPQSFCDTITAPSSGSYVYYKSHAEGPNNEKYSSLYSTVLHNDCYTGGDAGDSSGSADTISLPKSNCPGVLHSSDTQDWFRFNVGVGDTIDITMDPVNDDFDICLYNPSGVQIECSTGGGSSTERISEIAVVPGYYKLKVYRYSGDGVYSLSVSAEGLL